MIRDIIIDIYKIFAHHCRHESNRVLSGWQEWFYTIKAFLCYLSGRWWFDIDDAPYSDMILVAVISGGSNHSVDGTYYWHEGIFVGQGYFKNWHIIWNGESS